jgi:pyruvate dehydrogenase E1 component alpha subunit
VKNIAERAAAYSMPGVIVDGNNFADVADAAHEATLRARRGEGPTLIENKTYRTKGHSRSDRNRYRTKEEIESWMGRDPIRLFETDLQQFKLVSQDEIGAIHQQVEDEIAAAIEFASNSPSPSVAALTRDVYTVI